MSKTAQNGKGSKPRGNHKEYAEAQIWCKCGKIECASSGLIYAKMEELEQDD
jgi:hypothetical protein